MKLIVYFGLLLLANSAFCQGGDDVVISGYVKCSEGGISKPAVGSQIFILDIRELPEEDRRSRSIDSVLRIRHMLSRAKFSEDARDTLRAFKISSVNDLLFRQMEGRAVEQYLKIIHNNKTSTTSVDSSGRYSIRTAPGGYWLVMKSECHTSLLLGEMGSVFKAFVFAKAGQRPEFNFKFPRLYDKSSKD